MPVNPVARPRHHSCESHKNKIHSSGYLTVKPDDVLTRLRRAKETGLDPQLIIADVREARLYQAGHVLTARSASCYTKTMARRAIASWDCSFADELGCPAPAHSCQANFCIQISQVSGPSVVVYDQRGDVFPSRMPDGSAVRYFIDALIQRGNLVYFMVGGFEAFKLLRSADFIDRGPPVSITVSSVEDVARPFHPNDKPAAPPPPPCSLVPPTIPPLMLLECVTGLRSASCDPPGPIHCAKTNVQSLCSSPSQPVLGNTNPAPFSNGFDLPSLNMRSMLAARTRRRNMDTSSNSALSSSQHSLRSDLEDDVMNASISKILPYLYLGFCPFYPMRRMMKAPWQPCCLAPNGLESWLKLSLINHFPSSHIGPLSKRKSRS
ncbi:Dual specificity protein phosphatase 10 [Fasciola hepatica]|uniref:Dual specificity protein phosphatase 10 n=1 Tax=Fasciola hepatica TaxID=6192 RepID=A0A4E0RQ86_FASHE|nr:Dual specificity protein phosphatase 10 [Fasciola hepatica]